MNNRFLQGSIVALMIIIIMQLLCITNANANDWESHRVEILYYACECYDELGDERELCGYSKEMLKICEEQY